MIRLRALILAVVFTACQSVAVVPHHSMVADRLFFGRNIPAGGTVTDIEWERFLRSVITPRFPKGLTIWQANGQWLDPRGEIVREPVFVVEIFHEVNDEDNVSIAAIAAEYEKRFGQDAVLRITTLSETHFY